MREDIDTGVLIMKLRDKKQYKTLVVNLSGLILMKKTLIFLRFKTKYSDTLKKQTKNY